MKWVRAKIFRNQDNVSEWRDMSTRELMNYENPTKRVVLVQSGYQYHLIDFNLFSQLKSPHLALNNNISVDVHS